MSAPGGQDEAGRHAGEAFASRAVHAGQRPREHNGAVSVPIYQVSTFERPVVLDGGWDYSRIANPTRSALEECLADLEGGARATATGSGMAATTTALLSLCRAGDHVVVPAATYGGTWDLLTEVLAGWGLEHTTVDMQDLAAVDAAVRPSTTLVWAETPTNPLMTITDISAVAAVAHEAGALLAVDGTFGSPYLQQPLGLGADVVVHSSTKYLSGHSDVTGGVVISADPAVGARVARTCGMIGTAAAPFDSWLVLRGVKTLPVRMRQSCGSAMRIAEWLDEHPAVSRVHYPGLPAHPDHDLAKRQMRDFGGVVSFEVDGDLQAASEVCSRLRLVTLAVSLGSVESLVQHPARMTHCTLTGEAAMPDSLLRLSVGLEDTGELIADLEQALASLTA